jgi:RimJ/RimL family protein N-acetyltransferase/uncharacterized glyoxalase superfamily protein PhnB
MTTTSITLQTDRLQLEPLSLDDAPALFELFHDPLAMPHWHTLLHQTQEDTRAAIEAMLHPSQAHWWAVRISGTQETIGFMGFLGFGGIPGFGYAIHPAHRSHGYAAEAARAALDFGFQALNLERVELWIHEANTASRKLAHALGFTQRGCFRQVYPREGRSRETAVYGVTHAQWFGIEKIDTPAQSGPVFYGAEPILEVADVAAAVAFYRDRLGFAVDYVFGEPASHAGVSRSAWSTQGIKLQLTQHAAATSMSAGALYITAAPGLDRLHEEYARNGVTIIEALAVQPWGRREFTIRDPDGHLLRFGEPV